MIPTEKCCYDCGEVKPIAEFYPKKGAKFGVRGECKECSKRAALTDHYSHREARTARMREEYWNNREERLIDMAEYRQNNPETVKKSQKNWVDNNPTKVLERSRRRLQKPHERVVAACRSRINKVIKLSPKSDSTEGLLGCSIDQFLGHIEINFQEGMTWENYGQWHVDHRRPCASFDLTDPAQQRECFNWKNLQPLWADDNLRKGAKVLNG